MTPVGLGLRALGPGAVVVGVAVEDGEPRVVISSFLATGAEGDRLSLQPYSAAAETERDPRSGASLEAAAVVTEGRKRQGRLAATGLRAIVRALEDESCEPFVAALLVNRAGWVTDLLAYSLSRPEHVPVAGGLAVRDALRFALRECRIAVDELDEKSLPALAAKAFGTSARAIDARLKASGAAVGRPWRKEQKLACLSAWFAVTERQRRPATPER